MKLNAFLFIFFHDQKLLDCKVVAYLLGKSPTIINID